MERLGGRVLQRPVRLLVDPRGRRHHAQGTPLGGELAGGASEKVEHGGEGEVPGLGRVGMEGHPRLGFGEGVGREGVCSLPITLPRPRSVEPDGSPVETTRGSLCIAEGQVTMVRPGAPGPGRGPLAGIRTYASHRDADAVSVVGPGLRHALVGGRLQERVLPVGAVGEATRTRLPGAMR